MPQTLPQRATSRYWFDEFEIDIPAYELRRFGRAVPLEPQVFEVLLLLVRNHDRCLTKDEILDAVWPERYVTEAALNSRVMSARKALDDDGRQQRYIKTIHGRGYRFVGQVGDGDVQSQPPVAAGHAQTAPSSTAGVATPAPGIPRPVTSFVGRERELARLRDLLAQPQARLISVVGPGGIGKTRLLLEALREPLDAPPVVYVPLQTVTDVRGAAFAIAAALGMTIVDTEHCEQIVAALADRQLLLALDNVEQLIETTGPYLSELLMAAPGVRLVVTSRSVLGHAEEWIFRVDGLAHEGPGAAAVRLFEERLAQASAHGASVLVKPGEVEALCEIVGGMPLAIELAASLARYTPLSELIPRIRRHPSALESQLRNVPERHRSLAALFDESFGRLRPPERASMEALAVFNGTFSAGAAEAVTGASAAMLHSLADQSLVHVAEGRFYLHPLVRQYALDCCGDRTAALREAHAEYYAGYLHERGPALNGAGQVEATHEIESELHNLGAAWRWACLESRTELIAQSLPLLTALTLRGRFLEADDLATLALPVLEAGKPPGTLAQVLTAYAWLLMLTGRPAEAMGAAQRARAIADVAGLEPASGIARDPAMVASVLQYGGGDYAGSLELSLASRERAASREDPGGQAFAAWFAGAARLRQTKLEWAATPDGRHAFRPAAGDTAVQEAAALVEEAAVILEVLGETWLRGFVEIERGMSALAQGNEAGAIGHFLRARSLGSAFADPQVVGTALIFLADQYVERGDWDAAMECEAEARRLGNNSADAACLAECERVRTRILLGQGHLDEARGAIVAAVRRSQAIDFANNCCSSIRYFGDYARRSGALRPAAEAFAFVVAHPATTPFARAQVVADLESLAEQLGGAEIDHIRRGAELAEMDAVADRAVHLLGVPGPLSPGASLFDGQATAQAA